MPTVQFGEWLPDQPDFQNPGSTVITNVIPEENSYAPFADQNVISTNGMNGTPSAAFATVDRTGNIRTYGADDSTLYELQSGAWQSVTASPSATSGFKLATNDRWEFAQYGQLVIATQINDPIQQNTIDGTSFSSLVTSTLKPRAKHLAVVRDFLVLGYTEENGTRHPQRVRWSAFDNAADFDQSQTTLSDFQDLVGNGGIIQAVVGGEEGIIFQTRSIWKMSFIGTPLVFQFDEIQPNRGTIAPYSVVRYGDQIYFLDQDGFYVMQVSSGQVQDIGRERVNNFFFNDWDNSLAAEIRSTISPADGIVTWAYTSTSTVGSNPDRLLLYNWKVDRWSLIHTNTVDLYPALSLGYTLEELDQFSSSIDSLNFSLDSRAWIGGLARLGGLNENGELIFFDGDPLNATLETKELQTQEGYRQVVTSIRPYVDFASQSASLTIQLGTRNTHQESYSYGPKISLNAIGEAPMRQNGRYVRARVNVKGKWKHAQGVNVLRQTKAGRR